jgi:hypothetical protein
LRSQLDKELIGKNFAVVDLTDITYQADPV